MTDNSAAPSIVPSTSQPSTSWKYENFEPAGSAIGYRINRKLEEVQSQFQKREI